VAAEVDLTAAVQVALTAVRPGAVVTGTEVLDGSDRTLVVRVLLRGVEVPGVVVKLHLPQEGRESLVREPAAFAVLPGGAGVPRLLGLSTDPPGIVMEDLGRGTDVATALLGHDPAAARAGVLRWAAALGTFQCRSAAVLPAFSAALAEHAERLRLPVPASDMMPALLATAAEVLAEQLPRLGVQPSAGALRELRAVTDLLGQSGARLTPADSCPDNNWWDRERFVLLDLEGAMVRHAAWDGAYLQVPWPSCWCSWQLPSDVAREGLDVWRQEVGVAVSDDELDVATLAWAFLSGSWFLPAALAGTPQTAEEAAVMPTRRAMVQHRLSSAPRPEALPALSALADEAAGATVTAWGHEPLLPAPAFR
jgi:hypothetical protein